MDRKKGERNKKKEVRDRILQRKKGIRKVRRESERKNGGEEKVQKTAKRKGREVKEDIFETEKVRRTVRMAIRERRGGEERESAAGMRY